MHPSPERPVFSRRYKGVVLALLVTAYTFNFIDRTIVATIGQAIKVDLKITDTQLGLLGGLSFAVLYTVLGIPIARVAERWNRVSVISLAMVVWSGFTVACGLAGNFITLLLLRVGVGVGEAGCSPPAHSLISDYFEPRRRASALAIYAFGIPLGTMIGAALGGVLAKAFGWRVAFMAVGAPGVIAAILIKLVVREPPHGHSDERPAQVAAPTTEWRELVGVTKSLFGRWPVLNMILGITLVSFAGYGAGQFAPPYFNRAFGLDYATVGLIFGLIAGFSGGVGTLLGGFVSDALGKHDARWYPLTPAIALTVAFPLHILVYSQSDWRTAALFVLLPGFFAGSYLGPSFAVVQNAVDARRRATATAVTFLFLNLIALGGGPLFTGWIIDRFAAHAFLVPGGHSLWASLSSVFGGHAPVADFAHACPGGKAPVGAAAEVVTACKTTLVASTRQGIIVTYFFYVWAIIHFFLASIGMRKVLRPAEPALILAA